MISKFLESIGEWLIETRQLKNLTQEELAHLSGLHEGVIRRYEADQYQKCSLARVSHICEVLENYRPHT
ncbi:MAG: helix-turn-helix transcriptional regulator [Okeania sp. SIO2C9]|uniref:helix-turn-helix domain-containing protein n=1 Tax=Okeania sp. SIO2C9 TaxID=2607791 RepID=UPI0013C0AFDD|nr:helix-turn-helix transcriptional regulator [Okeania sp. SIO2C9]NEQ78225.1 helix-turn-helix transcriptional regulator [Okeania sp. SIO2C9]